MPPQTEALSASEDDSLPAGTTHRLRNLADLPAPPGWPIVGNALQLQKGQVHQNMEALCDVYGPYFRVKFGGRTMLAVADHEAIAKILRARPHDFRRSSRLAEAAHSMGLNLGLFMAEGEHWHNQRRMVMASFAPQRIRSYFPSMLNVTSRLQGRWQKAAKEGAAIDLQADLMRYTIDTITGLAFGHNVNTLQADGDVIQQHLDQIFPALFKRILAVVPYWKLIKLPSDRRLEHSVAEVNKAIDGFIAQARARLQQDPARHAAPPNLLEAFIVAAESEGSDVSDADVKDNVLTMLLAGEDTTANTLAWLIYLLKQNPATLTRAIEEVHAIAPGGLADFTPERMAAMDYLDACANEAMRLKPVAPFMVSEALRDTTVADIAVPKGTLLWNVMRHASLSEQNLPEPLAFKPERWLSDHSPAKHVSMPFGSGPRICPGRYLALLEIKMAMAMLLSHFDIASVDTPDGLEARELLAFTMGPDGLTMRLTVK